MSKKYTKLIYVAGPYTSIEQNGNWSYKGVEDNIMRAEVVSVKLWKKGWAVLCPHKNTGGLEKYQDEELTEQAWIEGDLTMLEKCDAMLVLKNHSQSNGTIGEINFAIEKGIPIFYETDGIPEVGDIEV